MGEDATDGTPRSFRPMMFVQGQWSGNALRFATRGEAQANAEELQSRWLLVDDVRVDESSDQPNYRWVDGRLERLINEPAVTSETTYSVEHELRIHCVNVIGERRPSARTYAVKMALVLARSEAEAMDMVAKDAYPSERLEYRNVFARESIITWSHQTWSREEGDARRAKGRPGEWKSSDDPI